MARSGCRTLARCRGRSPRRPQADEAPAKPELAPTAVGAGLRRQEVKARFFIFANSDLFILFGVCPLTIAAGCAINILDRGAACQEYAVRNGLPKTAPPKGTAAEDVSVAGSDPAERNNRRFAVAFAESYRGKLI